MMLKLECPGGGFKTYVCRHLTMTPTWPGSAVAERNGSRVRLQLELSGVTSITTESRSSQGVQVVTESRPAETIRVHLPEDGPSAYHLDQNRNTIKVYRPPSDAGELGASQ